MTWGLLRPSRQHLMAVVLFLLWSAAFAIAFTQWPLYSENQNTKFLHGLAAAGFGWLADDWLANTVDPLPAFSYLVAFTQRLLHPYFFYGWQALLLGIYLFSLVEIADAVFAIKATRAGKGFFLVTVIALHASLVVPFSLPWLGTSVGWLLQAGVANQYLLNPVFQPATFGVLLVASIALYLRDRPIWAAVIAALAAVMHTTYLPSAGLLVALYMFGVWRRERRLRSALAVGVPALLIVLPVVVYSVVALGPTSGAAWDRAQSIIVNDRIPHHSLPQVWFNATVVVKLCIVAVALLVVKLGVNPTTEIKSADLAQSPHGDSPRDSQTQRSRLFTVMACATIVGVGFTLLQIYFPSNFVAFVAPWRMSVFLVPLSTSLLVAWTIASLCCWRVAWVRRRQRSLLILAYLLLFVVALQGAAAMQDSFRARREDGRAALFAFVRNDAMQADRAPTYLTPTSEADFRLATGVPVVATWKSHPYLDVEVIEWKGRVDAINSFYYAPSCAQADTLTSRYGVTHILFEGGQPLQDCARLALAYQDERYAVFTVQGAP